MKSIILISILFLSSSLTKGNNKTFGSDVNDVCAEWGDSLISAMKKYAQCMKQHLKDTGDEGKAKKCAPEFKGPPGHEAKEYCHINTKILKDSLACMEPYRSAMAKNKAFLECVRSSDYVLKNHGLLFEKSDG